MSRRLPRHMRSKESRRQRSGAQAPRGEQTAPESPARRPAAPSTRSGRQTRGGVATARRSRSAAGVTAILVAILLVAVALLYMWRFINLGGP
ncbi:MAG TPA: hypothetical protein PLU39_02685 [Armatimonadota bacterium]|jgi:cobalamin biosynthesis Mg chelatase CobN|nr:hypothetical protein [Armatimonadota bacterium]HOJ19999.1 hypothetical protein [Armatimonadota bacterium]HOM83150.1 hypothetical protein [Armatimonadota bacterium]HOQ28884.1 hypothetical protein [Armatimonadota bacterium]HPO74492.1 hypothetical protein [Armatimonadota bacterium]